MTRTHTIAGTVSIAITMAESFRRSGSDRAIIMDTGSITNMHTIDGIADITTTTVMAITMAGDITADTTADTMVEDTIKNSERLQIFLCRHGETEWTLTGRHTSFSDISLTENGRKQAIVLGKRLQGISFHKVIVSPMVRAQETCQLARLDHHKIIEPYAMEWNYGEYEGITTAPNLGKARRVEYIR